MFDTSRLFKIIGSFAAFAGVFFLSATIAGGGITNASGKSVQPGQLAHTNASTREVSNITITSAQSTSQSPAAAYISPIIFPDHEFNAIGANVFGSARVSDGAPDTQDTLRIEVKVLEANGRGWTNWQALEFSDDWKNAQPEALDKAKGAFTDLLFVSHATQVQYRITFADRPSGSSSASPGIAEIDKIKLVFIDSSQGPIINAQSGKATRPLASSFGRVVGWFSNAIARAADIDETFKPAVVSREEWGADPALMTWTPEYKTPASKIILHHTAGSQGGSDSAAVVRGIYYYHAIVREWGDIGYNYIVDEKGTIFEGRFGGNNVTGGHTYGFNTGTIGISMLGDYEQDQPSPEMQGAISHLSGYLSYKNAFLPTSDGLINGLNKPNIAGHRDYDATLCPGQNNYNLLGNIRDTAQNQYNVISAQAGVGSVAYAGQLVSIDWPDQIGVGQRVKVTARFKNIGYQTWHNSSYSQTKYRDFIALDTQSPSQRSSKLKDAATWKDRNYRAGKLKELSVAPLQTGTIEFYLKAPDMPGSYKETFGLISEFNTAIEGAVVEKTISVDSAYHAKLVFMNIPKAMKAGSMTPVTFVYKNTGRAAWVNKGSKFIAMNINKPIGTTSVFANSRWVSAYRPAILKESRVNPGKTGHVVVWLKAPNKPGTYKFNASLVAEYFSWLPDSQVNTIIRVDK